MPNSRLLKTALACAVALCAALAPSEMAAQSKTMLFRVRAPNSGPTIYMLGSVHLLSPDAAKLPPAVDSAFARARLVAFETNLDTVQMRGQEMLGRARHTGGTTLRSSLSPAGAARADTLLKAYGLSVDQLAPFKPWFASIVMTQLVIQKAGFKAELGVDMQLNVRAKEAKKPVVGLESVDFQLGLFDSISPEDQEKMLTLGSPPDSSMKKLIEIKDTWMAGNTAKLDSLLNERIEQTAGLFATMITNRNRSWMPKIEQFLKGSDDVLVVVGAAHLVGKEGVLAMLKSKGYLVEQM